MIEISPSHELRRVRFGKLKSENEQYFRKVGLHKINHQGKHDQNAPICTQKASKANADATNRS